MLWKGHWGIKIKSFNTERIISAKQHEGHSELIKNYTTH